VFLGVGLGLVSGTLYDRGYLYVQPPPALSALDVDLRSYHLLIGGSLLQSFALFMLSLTQPGQYYEVRHPPADAFYEPSRRVGMTDLSYSRDRPWNSSGDSVRPDLGSGISLFPSTPYACNVPSRLWICTRIGRPPDHVELLD